MSTIASDSPLNISETVKR